MNYINSNAMKCTGEVANYTVYKLVISHLRGGCDIDIGREIETTRVYILYIVLKDTFLLIPPSQRTHHIDLYIFSCKYHIVYIIE